MTNRRDPILSRTVHKNLQILFLLVPIRLLAQSLHGELSGCDRVGCPYEHYGFPCEHQQTITLFELPGKTNTVLTAPDAKSMGDDPLARCLARRMSPIITATNLTATYTFPFDMAPGLAPKPR